MTDRELLELAAKAASIEIKTVIGDTFWRPDGITWNPLTDDGDALRLAVKLRIEPVFGTDFTQIDNGNSHPIELWGSDANAATRRAIVRAAAEIGAR